MRGEILGTTYTTIEGVLLQRELKEWDRGWQRKERKTRTRAEGKALVQGEKLMMQKGKKQIYGAISLSRQERTESMQ